MEQKEKTIQWHPVFLAGIQIELGDEAKYLSFEAEHQLGTKQMAIDVLIKKEKERVIEYKSPTDYLSVDDFYKVYGYACFYKSDVPNVDSISIEELTITLVSTSYPRKLIDEYQKHEKNVLYQSMMDVIVRANTQQFSREDKKMCEALRELMEEEFEAERGKARRETVKMVVSNLLEMNMPISDIIKATGESEEIVNKIIEELRK